MSNRLTIFRNYTQDEIPDNIQQVDIAKAQQIINKVPVSVDPQKIKVSHDTQTIKLNLHISTPGKSKNEV